MRIAHKDIKTLTQIKKTLQDDHICILDTFDDLRHVMKNNLDRGFYCIVPGQIIYDMTKAELHDVFHCPFDLEWDILDPYPEPLDEPVSDKTIRQLCIAKPKKNYVFYNGEILFTCDKVGQNKNGVSSFAIGRIFTECRPETSRHISDTRPTSSLAIQDNIISFRFFQDDTHPIRKAFIGLLETCKRNNKTSSKTLTGAYRSKYGIFIREMEAKGNVEKPYSTTQKSTISSTYLKDPMHIVRVETKPTTSSKTFYTWAYNEMGSARLGLAKYHEMPDPEFFPVPISTISLINIFLTKWHVD